MFRPTTTGNLFCQLFCLSYKLCKGIMILFEKHRRKRFLKEKIEYLHKKKYFCICSSLDQHTNQKHFSIQSTKEKRLRKGLFDYVGMQSYIHNSGGKLR